MNKKERNKWERYFTPYGKFESTEKKTKNQNILIQNGLFPEIKIEEIIEVSPKLDSKTDSKSNKEEQEITEKGNIKRNMEKKNETKIIHRKNFGIIQENISKNLDKDWNNHNDKCIKFCHKGARWTYYGLRNIQFSVEEYRIFRLKQMPVQIYDVLNEAEIYAFLSAVWIGKCFRDGNSINSINSKLENVISISNITTSDFDELIADLIANGESLLSPHWNLEAILKKKDSNPYSSEYWHLRERLKLIPEEQQSIIKEILKAKVIYPSKKIRGEYTIGFEIRDVMCLWKEDQNGYHVKFKSLPEEVRKKLKYFDDERKCAEHVYNYFKKMHESWTPWKEGIEIE